MNKDVIYTCVHIYINLHSRALLNITTFSRVPNAFAPTHTRCSFLFLRFSLAKSKTHGGCSISCHVHARERKNLLSLELAWLPHKKKGKRSSIPSLLPEEYEHEELIINTDRLIMFA